ncbi:MAG: copper transporter [Bacillota bacterium]|nr:copper transporter [Bacillota bacterium]
MIDWRTHAFSLVAIFLALGLGVAIGMMLDSSADVALKQQEAALLELQRRLTATQSTLRQWEGRLQGELEVRRQEEAQSRAFLEETLGDRLAGRRVAVATLGTVPWGSVLEALTLAGAEKGRLLAVDGTWYTRRSEAFSRLEGEPSPAAAETSFAMAALAGQGPDTFFTLARGQEAGILMAGGEAEEADSLVILLDPALPFPEVRQGLSLWLDTARQEGKKAVVAVPSGAPLSLTQALLGLSVPTVAGVDTPFGQAALIWALAGGEGHLGPEPQPLPPWPLEEPNP